MRREVFIEYGGFDEQRYRRPAIEDIELGTWIAADGGKIMLDPNIRPSLIRDIDGFILFPDNRILSRSVLTEMMADANRHRVQVAVFNEPLLEFGAGVPVGTGDHVQLAVAVEVGIVRALAMELVGQMEFSVSGARRIRRDRRTPQNDERYG